MAEGERDLGVARRNLEGRIVNMLATKWLGKWTQVARRPRDVRPQNLERRTRGHGAPHHVNLRMDVNISLKTVMIVIGMDPLTIAIMSTHPTSTARPHMAGSTSQGATLSHEACSDHAHSCFACLLLARELHGLPRGREMRIILRRPYVDVECIHLVQL